MPRISGVDIPENKRIEISLTYILGIGRTTSKQILEAVKIDSNMRTRDLNDDELTKIRKEIDAKVRVEGDVRREVSGNIKWKMDVGCYEGLRHRKNLPVRGQRTSTNARTRKGKSRAIAGKKKAPRG